MNRLLDRLRAIRNETLLRIACVLGLVALPLMVASILKPNVWLVLGALTVGQAIGTLSFVLYLIVVARDLDVFRRIRPSKTTTDTPPPRS